MSETNGDDTPDDTPDVDVPEEDFMTMQQAEADDTVDVHEDPFDGE